MKRIKIADTYLVVKDYHCVECGDFFKPLEGSSYIEKSETKLWLYVNATDFCNANCPFCVSRDSCSMTHSTVDPSAFEDTLQLIKDFVCGVSITGGEPTLALEVVNQLIEVTDKILGHDIEIDLVTNGSNLDKLMHMQWFDRLTSIHISRHHYDDDINNSIMQWKVPAPFDIRTFMQEVNNPSRVVFNCVLQKGGITSCSDVQKFLDYSISLGVRNTSFITMIKANDYCCENYISALMFPFVSSLGYAGWNNSHPNAQFDIWNYHRDRKYCSCLSGGYKNENGRTRFYFRCPGEEASPDICRQLVFTSSNVLQDGFGNNRKILMK